MNIKDDIIEEGDKEGKLKNIKSYAYEGICFSTYSNKSIECLNKEEAFGYRWYNELSFFNVDLEKNKAALNIIVENSKWKTRIKNNTFEITIKNEATINNNLTNLSVEEIKEKLNKEIKKDVYNTLKLAFEKDIDIYHLNDYAYRKKKQLKYNLENVKINVESKIKNTTYYKY